MPPDVLPRRPSDVEWNTLSEEFPALARIDVWITGEPTISYNGIAWSLEFTDRWIDPPPTLEASVQFYDEWGFVRVPSDGEVVVWALPDGTPTQVSRRYAEDEMLWETKLGRSYRITHAQEGLAGTEYGAIVLRFGLPEI